MDPSKRLIEEDLLYPGSRFDCNIITKSNKLQNTKMDLGKGGVLEMVRAVIIYSIVTLYQY
ncbi:MAG: hypothetical protein QN756_08185 [Nitrososphaeraceae archaeon]|nr:hypothetical protein [Nitrososphaeraceae archaeon]